MQIQTSQSGAGGRPLVTQMGRQLSGNIDMDLNFRKKSNPSTNNGGTQVIPNKIPAAQQ